MKGLKSLTMCTVAALVVLTSGCASDEHRMNVAAGRDEARRTDFEHCRAEGRSDCDAILNAPVNSNAFPADSTRDHERRSDAIRDQERREAYDRCKARGASDCDDLLH
jgi:hypothetical protein